MTNFRRGYHRISDDSVSSTAFATLEEALGDANKIRPDPDVDHVWVYREDDPVGARVDWKRED